MRSLKRPGFCYLLFLFISLTLLSLVSCQDCSATELCATGCCSQYGFCGTDAAHCGTGCLSTCDFKLGCDANNPCADGTCCSKFGFCGLGPDYCSPDNCVATCDAKAYCDPGGYGAAYVNVTECPLNVCCSQWGYCGTTEEFCGAKTVDRPSCSNTNPIQRVLGYYEGWAATRTCQSYFPEDIPSGVYTHLNYAFASIDPNTFAVVPASDGDVDLYSRLTALKQTDASLKVFISIGGWSFNDPGPTATTFSDLAASTANQQKFFVSLISFMSTYDFDGVDIDWEYPAASDRSGRPEDFANYPAFIKNLKLALKSAGEGRDGLTITVPVSYWYLQNFDIMNLEPWVDWFNVMSYDLHGLWDKGNKWLGPFLNSHTNLTEITEYMDLFWRNSISPSKINLGLAFYSRTFVASDPNCMEPACTFDSVGDSGPCTDGLGTLSNAELTDMMKKTGATSVLNQDAAVKILTIGKEWITYDDADTWALKLDFARSQCMGGVMVWAVSEDYADGTYSYQLQEATGYTSPSVTVERNANGGLFIYPSDDVVRNQCLWANCGQSCPSGYTGVPRTDSGARKNELMQDGTFCNGGQLRVYCCPANAQIPACGWYDFNNGKCGKNSNSLCGAGTTQVASNNGACGDKQTFQVACCESGTDYPSTLGYSQCVWEGTPKSCGVVQECSTTGSMSHFQFYSQQGSGAEYCNLVENGKVALTDYGRNYCCKPPAAGNQWNSCQYQTPTRNDDGSCNTYCPDGTIKLAAIKHHNPYNSVQCNGGDAMCCTPDFASSFGSDPSDTSDATYIQAIQYIANNPCDWSSMQSDDNLAKRNNGALSPALQARGGSGISYLCDVVLQNTLNMVRNINSGAGHRSALAWNAGVSSANLPNIPASTFVNAVTATSHPATIQTAIVEGLLNSLPELNADPEPDPEELCIPWDLYLPAVDDEDDGGEDFDFDDYSEYIYQRKRRDSMSEDIQDQLPHEILSERVAAGFSEIEERAASTGRSRRFWVSSQGNTAFSISSSPYPNGDGGDNLLDKTGDNHRYMLKPVGTCGPNDYYLDDSAGKGDSNKWVSEHILELQTLMRFLSATINGQFPPVAAANILATVLDKIDYPVARLFAQIFQVTGSQSSVPSSEVLAYFGSTIYPDGMVVADSFLNQIKSQIYRFQRPASDSKWASCCSGTTYSEGNAAMKYIQVVMAVFDYYDDSNVRARHQEAYEQAKALMGAFEDEYFIQYNVDIGEVMQKAWQNYMTGHFQRVEQFARWWIRSKLQPLFDVWLAKTQMSLTLAELEFASGMCDLLNSYAIEIGARQKLVFDTSIFT